MKRIICALMVIVWLGTIVGGCQSENRPSASERWSNSIPSESFNTQVGNVTALEKTLDQDQKTASVLLGVTWTGEHSVDSCIFTVGKYQHGEQKGLQATVSSAKGALLWQYTLAVEKGEQIAFWLTEKSQDDSLTVKVVEGATERTESYYRAGVAPLVLSCPNGLVERAILGEYLSSEESTQVEELRATYGEWRNSNSSLDNNRYAILINSLKDEPGFAAFLGPRALAKPMTDCPECEDVCFWAKTCALIKCLLPGNPVCWACSGVAIGCWAEEAWNRIVDFFSDWF